MYLIVYPSGASIKVNKGAQLLEALLNNGVQISYSCRDGRCGMCRIELVSGRVLEGGAPPWQIPGVELGYKLACQCSVIESSVIRLPDSGYSVTHPQLKLKGEVVEVKKLSERVVDISLSLPRDFSYSPGQFSKVWICKNIARTYSMAGYDRNNMVVNFHIQKHPFGRASSYVWGKMKSGDNVQIEGPWGVSYLRPDDGCPIICVSSETGIGPMLSVLRGIRDSGMENQVFIYVGFMRVEDRYYVNEIEKVVRDIKNAEPVQWVIYSADKECNFRSSTLRAAIESDFQDLREFRAYMYGSPYAINSVVRCLRRLRIKKERLHADAFVISDA